MLFLKDDGRERADWLLILDSLHRLYSWVSRDVTALPGLSKYGHPPLLSVKFIEIVGHFCSILGCVPLGGSGSLFLIQDHSDHGAPKERGFSALDQLP